MTHALPEETAVAPADIAFLPATELLLRLRRRELSAVELLQHHLRRIERLNPAINAVVVLDAERALQRARAADTALARGETWGPLHGLPMTVKESFDVAGLPTTWGFESLRDNVAPGHALAVQRLLDAGAVIFGKTNVPVALADWQTFNPVYGTTNNPWDPGRTPGGSSGGSAAALAAGLSALELGSDIGASIRNPAHYCGVWGHKPTWGVVPQQGQQLPGMECVDTIDIGAAGPLARSARDLTLAMDVLAAPLRSFGPLGWQPAAWRDQGLPAPRLRVAVIADDALAEVDASVREAIASLVRFLRESGVSVDEQARPVDSVEAWTTYVPMVRAALIGGISEEEHRQAAAEAAKWPAGSLEFAALHWRGRSLSHRDWLRLEEVRSKLRRQWAPADLPSGHDARLQTQPAGLALGTHDPRQRRRAAHHHLDVLGRLHQPVRPAGHRRAAGPVGRRPADRRAGLRPGLRRPGVPALRTLAGRRIPRLRAAADGGLRAARRRGDALRPRRG